MAVIKYRVTLTTMLGRGFSGVYRAPKGMTALVASMRLLGHTFHDNLMPSVSSSSENASDMVPQRPSASQVLRRIEMRTSMSRPAQQPAVPR